jgi:hypothetical protein
VRVGDRPLKAEKIFINVGARPALFSNWELDTVDADALAHQPAHLAWPAYREVGYPQAKRQDQIASLFGSTRETAAMYGADPALGFLFIAAPLRLASAVGDGCDCPLVGQGPGAANIHARMEIGVAIFHSLRAFVDTLPAATHVLWSKKSYLGR